MLKKMPDGVYVGNPLPIYNRFFCTAKKSDRVLRPRCSDDELKANAIVASISNDTKKQRRRN